MSPDRNPAVVITADDFGRSPNVNMAIVQAFRRGLVSSVSIMANMPAFHEACQLAHENSMTNRVGVHLNLTQGRPLTEPIRKCHRFVDSTGQLRRRSGTIWRLTRQERTAIESELETQTRELLNAGIIPTHFDSHHHFHTQWPVATIVMRLARRFSVPAVRLARTCGVTNSSVKLLYRTGLNARLARAGLTRTHHFGSAGEVMTLPAISAPVEAMVHPELDSRGRLVDCVSGAGRFEDARPLEPVAEYFHHIGSVVSYADLTAA